MPRCSLRAQLGDDRQDGAGHPTGAARADLCDQASCGSHVRAWCTHSRYAKSGGRFHPCRPGVEPRRCDLGRDDKHRGSFNEAFSKAAARRAISARSRIPRKNLFQAGLTLSSDGDCVRCDPMETLPIGSSQGTQVRGRNFAGRAPPTARQAQHI